MKKRRLIVTILLCTALVFAGCDLLNPIPKEYTEGVKVPKDYPDRELEIYDDAIVFEAEDDDDEITIKYGTEDDIDDVIDFYEDLFEDEDDLTLDESEDDKDEYFAKGYGEDYEFEINAEEADKGYEEELFETVVEVTVEFTKSIQKPASPEDTPLATSAPGMAVVDKAQGFWLCCGVDGEIGDAYRMEGVACNFGNMVMDAYTGFEPDFTNNPFTLVDEDTLNYLEDNEPTDLHLSFNTVDGVEYLVIMFDNDTNKYYFEKSDYFTMLMYADMGGEEGSIINLEDELTDAELEYYISDIGWLYYFYELADGTADFYVVDYLMYMYSADKTGYDIEEGKREELTWYVSDGNLYCDYGETEYVWPIDYEYDGENAYLHLYSLDENEVGKKWVLRTLTDEELNNKINNAYCDEDIEHVLIEKQWEYMYYEYADGTLEYPESSTFYERYFTDVYTGVYRDQMGTTSFEWYISDDELHMTYATGTTSFYPIEYVNSGSEYLYLMDTEAGYEGGKWVYKAVSNSKMQGQSLSDEMWANKLVGSTWQTSHKVLADNSNDYDVPYRTMKYNADGSIEYIYEEDGQTVTTTIHYRIKNGVITYIMEDGTTEWHYVLRYTNNGTEEMHYLYRYDTDIDYTYVYYRDVE